MFIYICGSCTFLYNYMLYFYIIIYALCKHVFYESIKDQILLYKYSSYRNKLIDILVLPVTTSNVTVG